MDAESARVEHLKLIQAVITRMARNSFAVKAGASTLVAAVAALALTNDTPTIAAYGALPIALLWSLDGYYLREERSFRGLYNTARIGPPPDPGSKTYFVMKEVENKGWGEQLAQLIGAMYAGTLLVFYVALLGVLGVATAVAVR